jgi:hypothetical protein
VETEHHQLGVVLVVRVAVVASAHPLRDAERSKRVHDPVGNGVIAHDHVRRDG